MSRTVLRETQGEIPWVYSPKVIPFSFATVLPSLFGVLYARPPRLNNAALLTNRRSILMPDLRF